MPTKEVSFKSASDNADFKASLQVDENLGTKQIRNLVMSDTTAHIFLIITIWDQQFVLQSSKKMDSSNNQSSICRWVWFFCFITTIAWTKRFQKHAGWGDDHRLICNDLNFTAQFEGWMDGWGSIPHGCNATYIWVVFQPQNGWWTYWKKKNGNKNGWFRGENRKPKTPLFWETSISCPRDPGSPYENDVMEPFECEPGSLGLGKHPPPSF